MIIQTGSKSPGGADVESAPMLATAVVPWTANYDFDEETFVRQVHQLARELTPNLYIFGTAGEGYAVSDRQFDQVAGAFWRSTADVQACPLLGVISLSLRRL